MKNYKNHKKEKEIQKNIYKKNNYKKNKRMMK